MTVSTARRPAGCALLALLLWGAQPSWTQENEALDKCMDGGQELAVRVKACREAAEQGDAEAQFNIGVMYDNGRGVPQDDAQAHMWFNLAGARGHEKAREARDAVRARMTPEQVAEAQRLAREWKPRN